MVVWILLCRAVRQWVWNSNNNGIRWLLYHLMVWNELERRDDVQVNKMAEPEQTEIAEDELTDNIVVSVKPVLKRGDGEFITKITVRPPTAGQINKVGGRMMLLQMLDSAHAKLLARTTSPQITPQMYNKLPLSESQKLINANLTFLAGSSDDEMFED